MNINTNKQETPLDKIGGYPEAPTREVEEYECHADNTLHMLSDFIRDILGEFFYDTWELAALSGTHVEYLLDLMEEGKLLGIGSPWDEYYHPKTDPMVARLLATGAAV